MASNHEITQYIRLKINIFSIRTNNKAAAAEV